MAGPNNNPLDCSDFYHTKQSPAQGRGRTQVQRRPFSLRRQGPARANSARPGLRNGLPLTSSRLSRAE